MGETAYQKLPKQWLGWNLSRHLGQGHEVAYLADDHLLIVHSIVFREEYHRFYFEDIAAIQAWDSRGHLYGSLLFAGLSVACLVAALAQYSQPDGEPLFALGLAAFSLLPFIALAWNLFGGPSCHCRLLVGGEWRTVRVFNRWAKLRAAWPLLEPRLLAAQSGLAAQAGEGELVQALAAAPDQADLPASTPVSLRATRISFWAAGLTALASAFFDASAFVTPINIWLSQILTYASWAGLAVSLVFVLRAGRRALWPALAGLAAAAFQIFSQSFYGFYWLLKNRGHDLPQDLHERLQDPAFAVIFATSLLLLALVGIWQCLSAERLGREA